MPKRKESELTERVERIKALVQQRDVLSRELMTYKDGPRDGAKVGKGRGKLRVDITAERVAKINSEIADLERLIAKA